MLDIVRARSRLLSSHTPKSGDKLGRFCSNPKLLERQKKMFNTIALLACHLASLKSEVVEGRGEVLSACETGVKQWPAEGTVCSLSLGDHLYAL